MRAGLVLAAVVAGLVVAPVIAFSAAKSRPQHGAPPPTHATQQPHQKAQTAPAVSI